MWGRGNTGLGRGWGKSGGCGRGLPGDAVAFGGAGGCAGSAAGGLRAVREVPDLAIPAGCDASDRCSRTVRMLATVGLEHGAKVAAVGNGAGVEDVVEAVEDCVAQRGGFLAFLLLADECSNELAGGGEQGAVAGVLVEERPQLVGQGEMEGAGHGGVWLEGGA